MTALRTFTYVNMCIDAHIFPCSEVVSMHMNVHGTCTHVNTDARADTDYASKLHICQKAHMHVHETTLIIFMHGKVAYVNLLRTATI